MMQGTSAALTLDEPTRLRAGPAASWAAILAGAVVAVSVSLILIILGAGLGFAAVSPWPERGVSAYGFTVGGTIWLIVTQWLSAAIGGYIAGRLRQRWLVTHVHEVFFRDTAHGLVTWSVSTLLVAFILIASTAGVAREGAHALGAAAAAGGEAAMMHGMPQGPMRGGEDKSGPGGSYELDKLFRNAAPLTGEPPAPGNFARGGDSKLQALHIAASAVTSGNVPTDDRIYLASLVAAQTGVTTDEAQRRVDAFIQSVQDGATKAKAAADDARKSAATMALYTSLALLIGAFIASVSAALGGKLRDGHL
jgi:hypothetical protein